MSWRGAVWNKQEMKEQGRRAVLNMSQNLAVPPVPSFTPINHNHAPAPFPFVSPLKTRRGRALDSDAFYDTIPFDTTPTNQEKKRRASAAASTDRTALYTPLQPDQDEGEIQYQSQGIQAHEPPRKKHKPVPLHPQLISPPDTGKRLAKGVGCSKMANKERKMGAFKTLRVTKPKTTPELEVRTKGDALISEPVKGDIRWTTTQEAVKLSKTTLDKLAGFRYTHVSSEELSKAALANLPIDYHSQGRQRERVISKFSDDNLASNMLFNNEQNSEQAQPQESPHPAGDYHSIQMQLQSEDGRYLADTGGDYHMKHITSFEEAVWDSTDRREKASNIPAIDQQYQVHGTNNFNSSTGLLIDRQSGLEFNNELGNNAQSPEKDTSKLLPIPEIHTSEAIHQSSSFEYLSSNGASLMTLGPSRKDDQNAIRITHTRFGSNQVDALCDRDFAHVKLNIRKESSTSHSQTHPETEAPLEPETVDINEFDIDGFDDEINDEDLLELACTSNLQGHTSTGYGNLEREGNKTQLRDNFLDNLPIVLPVHQAKSILISTLEEQKDSYPAFMAISEPDDEYPLDEGDEEAMLNIQEHKTGILGNHEVPPSLNYSAHQNFASGKVYDRSLQCSAPNSRASVSPGKITDRLSADQDRNNSAGLPGRNLCPVISNDNEDWSFIRSNLSRSSVPRSIVDSQARTPVASPFKSQKPRASTTKDIDQNLLRIAVSQPRTIDLTESTKITYILDDSQEYEPLHPFARPDFPSLIRDRSPIVGLSTQTFLRVCFRVGEMFKEGGRCEALNQNAMIELYARVTFSSREAGTTKQHFQFADLWHDRPPYATGLLANYKSSGLAETESTLFVGATESIMARCFGTLKRHVKSANGWLLYIVSIRETDWEEIRWTKRIVSAGLVKTERPNL